MAGPCTHRSSCWNLLPTNKDELAVVAPTEGNGTLTYTFVVFCAPTPAPATSPAVDLSLDNKLFK